MANNNLNLGKGESTVNYLDAFPSRGKVLNWYRGVNIFDKDKQIFVREENQNIKSLKFLGSTSGVEGSIIGTTTQTPIQEEKVTTGTKLDTALTRNLYFDVLDGISIYLENDIYFTIGDGFQESYKTNPTSLYKLSSTKTASISSLLEGSIPKNVDGNTRTTFAIFSQATQFNNLSGANLVFIGDEIISIPTENPSFEITSIDVETDHSFLPEYGNWFHVEGKLKKQDGKITEDEIDLKMDKPLMKININPFGKVNKLQFLLMNFNKYFEMPWVFARKFAGNDKEIDGYILQTTTEQWGKDLVQAVKNMFLMSWAFNTNFLAFRDDNGDVKNKQIGGVSLENLEGTDPDAAVDAVLSAWEYNNPEYKKTKEFIRARQIIAAASEWIASSYAFDKGKTTIHKSLLTWYLRLDTNISKDVEHDGNGNYSINKIECTLESKHVLFTEKNAANKEVAIVDSEGTQSFVPRELSSASNIIVDELISDRYISYPEIPDPIALSNVPSFPGDVKGTSSDAFKYAVGIDVISRENLPKFFINDEKAGQTIQKVTKKADTDLLAASVPNGALAPLVEGQYIIGKRLWFNRNLNGLPNTTIKFADEIDELELLRKSITLPSNAYDLTITKPGTKITKNYDANWHGFIKLPTGNQIIGLVRLSSPTIQYTGVEYEYKLRQVDHTVEENRFAFDKTIFENDIIAFTEEDRFKRKLSLNNLYRDAKGNPTQIWKSISKITTNGFFGNDITFRINYRYTESGIAKTGTFTLPPRSLKASDDQTRTKNSWAF